MTDEIRSCINCVHINLCKHRDVMDRFFKDHSAIAKSSAIITWTHQLAEHCIYYEEVTREESQCK